MQVKVKRSFPLTSIEEVKYDDSTDATTFQLVLSNCVEVLKAETVEDARDWVEKIVSGKCRSFSHYLTTLGPRNRLPWQ